MNKKIYIGISIAAIVGLALYFYTQKKPNPNPSGPSGPVKSSGGGGLSIKEKKDWITANAKKVYGIEKNFSMETSSDVKFPCLG